MFLVDWAVKMRIRPPEFETSIFDAKYHVSLGDEGVSYPVVDRIGDIYRNLPRRVDVIVTKPGGVIRIPNRAAIPHSHLPARIVATMRRVVNYNSSWARQHQVELFDASGNPGSTAGRGFNPAGGAPGGG
ncbi:hypothetical protein F511_09807 [Dorcoceras hygrometricum]|uniref:Uncharacterized protein n=1 Tax=Dorcoceras hygrometricum TaxID=472368 RepID=A0A2Z7C0E2_9LAMI|nr:hypothetical protein F511_09807 [Dorcoceras hygrometricum]